MSFFSTSQMQQWAEPHGGETLIEDVMKTVATPLKNVWPRPWLQQT